MKIVKIKAFDHDGYMQWREYIRENGKWTLLFETYFDDVHWL